MDKKDVRIAELESKLAMVDRIIKDYAEEEITKQDMMWLWEDVNDNENEVVAVCSVDHWIFKGNNEKLDYVYNKIDGPVKLLMIKEGER